MKKIFILALAIPVFSVLVYAQVSYDGGLRVYEDQTYIDTQMPDVSMPNPDVIRTDEVFKIDIIREDASDSHPTAVAYTPDIFKGKPMNANLLHGSFSQDAAWNLRNNFGFSLGAHEGYYRNKKSFENTDLDSDMEQSAYATSLSASVFTNYTRGKYAMHLDYGTGYSFYSEERNFADPINHNASAAFRYRINNRASFNLQDRLTSHSNDPLGDISSANSSFGRSLIGSSDFDIITEGRYTRNTVSGSFNTDLTGKGTNVNLFGSCDNYWYGKQNPYNFTRKDTYSAKVGAGVSQRITGWLSLGTTYYIQLNDDLDDSQSHRIEIGSFNFNLSPDIEVFVSGGVVISKTGENGEYRTSEILRAGMTYSTEIGNLFANYSRNMTSVSGFEHMWLSDTVSFGFGRTLGERTNVRTSCNYQRSYNFDKSGHLSVRQLQASVEYVIVSGLFASASYSYRYQKTSIDTLLNVPHYERSTISGGLQYSWPSRRSR